MYIFFFQRYVYHQDLHSFPTRRSSDLTSAPRSTSVSISTAVCTVMCSDPMIFAPRNGCFPLYSARIAIRSEEHTSELQSRLHLVCRLLLEKKKQLRSQSIIVTLLNLNS